MNKKAIVGVVVILIAFGCNKQGTMGPEGPAGITTTVSSPARTVYSLTGTGNPVTITANEVSLGGGMPSVSVYIYFSVYPMDPSITDCWRERGGAFLTDGKVVIETDLGALYKVVIVK